MREGGVKDNSKFLRLGNQEDRNKEVRNYERF